MLCLIAGSYRKAMLWADSQHLSSDEWFYLSDVDDLIQKANFHVIVLDSASDLHPSHFERIFMLAKQRGRIGR